jgi:hypothetical protein
VFFLSELVSVVKAVRVRCSVVHWWGSCSYTKLRVTLEVRKQLCPFCGSELVDLDYSGSMALVTNRGAVGFVRDNWLPLFEDGVRVWHALPKRKRCWLIREKVEKSFD